MLKKYIHYPPQKQEAFMPQATFTITCNDQHALQHFRSVMSLLCDEVNLEMKEISASESKQALGLHEVTNERRYKRKNIDLQAVCLDYETSQELSVAKTINISHNGVCLNIAKPVAVGKKVKLTLQPEGLLHRHRQITGKVVWSNANKVGVQFLS